MKWCRSTAVSNVGRRLCPVRIAAGEVGRDIDEALGDRQLAQLVAAPCAVQPEHLAALRRDAPGGDQRAFPPVDLQPKAAASPGDGRDMDRRHRAARELSADQHVVRRSDLHQLLGIGLISLPGLGRDQARHPREVARDEAQGVDDVRVTGVFI